MRKQTKATAGCVTSGRLSANSINNNQGCNIVDKTCKKEHFNRLCRATI